MTPAKAAELARWIADNQPKLFAQLLSHAGNNKAQLGDIMDALSSFGTTVGNAVSSVGNFLISPDGIKTVSSLGAAYLTSQAQRDALQIQVSRASQNQPLAPIYTASAATASPAIGGGVYYQPLPTQPAVPFSVQLNQPSLGGIPLKYLLLGGAALVLTFFLMNYRRS
jgi:hypothetical protein